MKSTGRIYNNVSIVGSDYKAKGDENIVITIEGKDEPKLCDRFRCWLSEQPLKYHYHDYMFTILLSDEWSERMILDKVCELKQELGFK